MCHTSCTSWISEPITLKFARQRHVPRQQSRQIPYLLDVSIYVGGHPRGHQHRANPLSYITFHRSHVGESTKHDGKWMQFFARQPHNILDTFIQRRSANSKQDAKFNITQVALYKCFFSASIQRKASGLDQSCHPQIGLWKPKHLHRKLLPHHTLKTYAYRCFSKNYNQ